MEVPNTVWEAVIKTHPQEEEMQKGNTVVWGGLKIAQKRREGKGIGDLNGEFQRIAKRDKKAFLSDQRKEIEENNKMRKTRYIFRKIRDTKGTFHPTTGTIKDRNNMDLTEAEDIKKRWQEYTEETYTKKIFMIQTTTIVWSLT